MAGHDMIQKDVSVNTCERVLNGLWIYTVLTHITAEEEKTAEKFVCVHLQS